MIDLSELPLNTKIYVVEEKNNCFSKEKIKMVDEKGIEWFRYDRDHWEYSIKEILYCGKVTFKEEGVISPDYFPVDEYHFLWPDGKIYPESVPEEDWFLTREEAEERILEMKKLREHLL